MKLSDREPFLVDDLRVLEEINNPTRLRILYQLVEPATVREVADRLGVPVTRLYYHFNALERAGMIEVVETRKSGARLQRVYRALATHIKPGPSVLENADDPARVAEAVAGAVLDGARVDAVAGVTEYVQAKGRGEETPPGTLGRTIVRLSRESAARFAERIDELIDEIAEAEDRDGDEYAFSFVFFRLGI